MQQHSQSIYVMRAFSSYFPLTLLILLFFGVSLLAAWLFDPRTLPIKEVRIEGTISQPRQKLVESLVSSELKSGFFTVDVSDVYSRLSSQAWIKTVNVKRIWPDKLEISVYERVPLVIWQKEKYIDKNGVVFSLPGESLLHDLPVLSGPDVMSSELFEKWQAISIYLKSIGLYVSRLNLSSRFALDCELDNGMLIRIGTENQIQRMKRFVAMYPTIKKDQKTVIHVADLRYTNGIAIGS